jgi:hypothetical protein
MLDCEHNSSFIPDAQREVLRDLAGPSLTSPRPKSDTGLESIDKCADDLVEPERSRLGDLSSVRPYCSFHGGLGLQALEISRDGYSSESATAFLVR